MKKYNFQNKKVIISGASSGIGKSIAEILIKNYNCKVTGIGRTSSKFDKFASELGDKSSLLTWRIFDVSDKDEWIKFYNDSIKSHYIPDILINCAGVLPSFSAYNMESNQAEYIIKINFLSAVYSMETFLPLLKKSSTPKLINISSSSALCPFAGIAAYSASKAALMRFTECISLEKDISATVVLPGFTRSAIFRDQSFTDKNLNFFNKFAMKPNKVGNKIIKAVIKGKTRKIIGADAYAMDISYKLFPKLTPLIITKILTSVKSDAFSNITH